MRDWSSEVQLACKSGVYPFRGSPLPHGGAHPLPHTIPVHIDDTANEASALNEEVDIILTYGNHLE